MAGNVKAFEFWAPSIGEELTGRVLYFERHQDRSLVFIKAEERYLLLPADADDAFLVNKPADGSNIKVTRTDAGFRWVSIDD